jgi:hypothetical protein
MKQFKHTKTGKIYILDEIKDKELIDKLSRDKSFKEMIYT